MKDSTLLDIVQRFAGADCSWLTTVRADGRPHTAPIWHVWFEGKVYVVTKQRAIKVANIGQNDAVVLSHPDPHRAIIIDGRAQIVADMADRLRSFFQAKYDWDIVEDDHYDTIIAITPHKLLAWGEEGAAYRKRWTGEQLRLVDLTS
jgi:general stress protein 26